ncbi:unnamed protein product [Withania somnifera]
MAYKKDQLAKIGREGFDLIDEFWTNKRERPSAPQRPYYTSELRPNPTASSLYKYHPQNLIVCNTNSYEAVQMYQGVQYLPSNKKSTATVAFLITH